MSGLMMSHAATSQANVFLNKQQSPQPLIKESKNFYMVFSTEKK